MSIRKRSKLLSSIILGLLLIFLFTSTSYGDGEFEVNTKFGFNGYSKAEHLTPIQINIKNSFKDVNGKLQVLMPKSANNKTLYIAFSKKLNIAKDSDKTIKFNIPMDHMISYLEIRIVDDKGNILWSDISLLSQLPEQSNHKAIGILSDDIESLRYFGSIIIGNTQNKKEFFDIADLEDIFPEKSSLLEALEVIVINNYDTEKLNEKQRTALRDWVNKGGLLIIGTGPNQQKTMKGLKEISEVTNILDINSEDSIIEKSLGEGSVLVTSYDLGLNNSDESIKGEISISEILQKRFTKNNQPMNNMNYNNHRLSYLVNFVPLTRFPSFTKIIVLLLTFIVLVGPVNYLILRKLDKKEKIWITSPALAILFSLIIYLWGLGAGFDDAFVNRVSIIELNTKSNIAKVNSEIGVTGVRSNHIDLSFDGNVQFIPMFEFPYRYREKYKHKEIIMEYLFDKENHLMFKNEGVWDVQSVKTEEDMVLDKFLDPKLILDEKGYSLNVTNLSSSEIKDVVLIYGNSFKKVGDLPAGESKSIDLSLKSKVKNPNNNPKGYYNLINNLYSRNYSMRTSQNNNNRDDVLNDWVKADILESYFESQFETMNNNIKLISWSSIPLSRGIKVNGKNADSIDRNLIVMPIETEYTKGSKVDIPYGVLNPKTLEIKGLFFDRYDNAFNGKGYAIFAFNVDNKIDFNNIEIRLPGYSSKQPNVYLYNYNKDEWESFDKGDLIIDDTNKDEYYNEDNGVKVKVVLVDENMFETPEFSVKGVVK